VAGRLFTAGMQYWQLGESHYWGHNAILRVAPFMEHCALAPIHGRGGLAGEILSHDFVEAALMRRAGFSVWVVGDLEGSYEQQPPNLIEELQRDRRWCQGNLQNARLITEPGLHGVHRAMLLTGTMAYVSAPLWLAFVLVSALLGVLDDAPVRAAGQALSLFAISLATLAMLMLPRAMGVLAILLRREQTTYGGARSLLRGVLLEAGLSVLQSPVRMMAHTLFVVVALTGLKLDWKSPPREAEDLPWLDALQRFAAIDLVVLACFTMALALHSRVALWLMPVAVPLLLAVPLAVYTSRASLGERLRARGLLLTPEELATPAVLTQAWAHAAQAEPARPLPAYTPNDPWLLELVRWAVGRRAIQGVSGGHAQRLLSRGLLVDHATARAIAADLRQLLNEPQGVKRLLG
jgi:membrane glycosyltransferase